MQNQIILNLDQSQEQFIIPIQPLEEQFNLSITIQPKQFVLEQKPKLLARRPERPDYTKGHSHTTYCPDCIYCRFGQNYKNLSQH